jgi:hypothetical protein
MANTFELIASSTVGSGGASSISFTSIASTYTDLVLKISLRDGAGAFNDYILLQFNSSGGTAYSDRQLTGNGSAASSANRSGNAQIYAIASSGSSNTANTFSNGEIYIPNYASSANKSISLDAVNENNGTEAYANLTAGLWANSAAITSITITNNSATNFVQYSTAYLYGVKNA